MKILELLSILISVIVITSIFWLGNVDANAIKDEVLKNENVPTNNCVQRTENITKSYLDKRLYRFLKLKNDLQILLVSDPTTVASAASIAVSAGSLNDLKEMRGSAHFLEHMLFMGCEKYKNESEYGDFINSHGGYNNACTYHDLTYYYFQIATDSLAQALDRLVQFFIAPLMKESSIEKEAKIVDSEYQMHISEDAWRLQQLRASLSKPDHPYNGFNIGSVKTLYEEPKSKGINIRESLFKLYNTCYSSNIMNAAVYGKESLDELEKMAVPLFECIKDKNVVPLKFEMKDHPWGVNQLQKKIYVLPVSDENYLTLTFPTPDVRSLYETALSYRIWRTGSLLSTFKENNLCSFGGDYYSTTAYDSSAGFGFFTIQFLLTPEAVNLTSNNIDEIVATVFQYIHLVKTEGIQQWIFDENTRKNELAFKFKDEMFPGNYLNIITPYMHHIAIQDILSFSYIHNRGEPAIIEDFLSYIRPDNMNIVIVSQSFQDIVDQREQWFGTQYKVEQIPDDLIQKWNTLELNPNLQLLKPNELIPQNLNLYPANNNESKISYVILESSLSRFWMLHDTKYKLPKLVVRFEILRYVSENPGNRNLAEMFAALFQDSMEEYTYSANQAGLDWSISATDCGLEIYAFGFNEKMPILVEKIMSEIINFKVNEKRLQTLKETYIRGLQNFEIQDLETQAEEYLQYLIREKKWTIKELLNAVEILQLANIEKFRSELFANLYIQGLIHGNCNEQTAMDIVNIVENAFISKSTGTTAEQLLPLRQAELSDELNLAYEKWNNFHPNSFHYTYIQIGPLCIRNETLLILFSEIVRQPIFNILRTEEQLGYYVNCYQRREDGVLGFTIVVESDKHPAFINFRVEEFLRSVKNFLEEMTDKEFETQKTSMVNKYLAKSKSLQSLSERHWKEITSRLYEFNRSEKLANELKSVTKADIISFYITTIEKSLQRGKLVIYVISQVTNPTLPNDVPDKCTKIQDIATFRNFAKFCAYPNPSIEISPLGSKPVAMTQQTVQ